MSRGTPYTVALSLGKAATAQAAGGMVDLALVWFGRPITTQSISPTTARELANALCAAADEAAPPPQQFVEFDLGPR